jgi:hypothetical protein
MMGIMRGKRRRIQLAAAPGLINRELGEEMYKISATFSVTFRLLR